MNIRSRRKPGRTGNRLLDSLPPRDLKALTPQIEALDLPARQVLLEVNEPFEYLYFPVSAVLALTAAPTSGNNQGIEIGTVGNEGLVGFTALLGVPTSFHQTACQAPGECLRLPVQFLAQAMAQRPAIDNLVKKYVAVAYRTVIQSAVCNALHQVEQRVCRWLLVTHEKTAGEFPMTQDLLAIRLGVKRPTISLVANSLLKDGLITYHRGAVRILDQERLEQAACDCFKITKAVYERIIER
jgi:CRP-like cAMP-binding protein